MLAIFPMERVKQISVNVPNVIKKDWMHDLDESFNAVNIRTLVANHNKNRILFEQWRK